MIETLFGVRSLQFETTISPAGHRYNEKLLAIDLFSVPAPTETKDKPVSMVNGQKNNKL